MQSTLQEISRNASAELLMRPDQSVCIEARLSEPSDAPTSDTASVFPSRKLIAPIPHMNSPPECPYGYSPMTQATF